MARIRVTLLLLLAAAASGPSCASGRRVDVRFLEPQGANLRIAGKPCGRIPTTTPVPVGRRTELTLTFSDEFLSGIGATASEIGRAREGGHAQVRGQLTLTREANVVPEFRLKRDVVYRVVFGNEIVNLGWIDPAGDRTLSFQGSAIGLAD